MTRGHYIQGEYPPDWPAIARRIKETAGWRCERCKHPAEGTWKMGKEALESLARRAPYELEHSKNRGRQACDSLCRHSNNGKQRVLTVDHLDGDKSNCADWNLAALCQVCHLQIQGKVRMEQFYSFEHTPWMQPHVDGMLGAQQAKETP